MAPGRGRLGLWSSLHDRIRCSSLGIFCTDRFLSAGVVTALSDRFRSGGPFPAQQRSCFNPARPHIAVLAGKKYPLYARVIEIFSGPRLASAAFVSCHLPYS